MPQGLLEEIEKAYQTRPVDAHFDHYEFAMDVQMNKQDLTYRVVAYDGPWKPIKYPWHVLDVMDYFLGQIDKPHISSQAVVMDNVRIDGDVVIEAGARVFNGASIVGPAYIGAGSTVGDGALVRESMIGKGCSVGHTSEVARSYLADGCELHRAVVLDSVFDESVNFSAGCITANLRWDRNEVKSTVDGDRLLTGRRKFGAVVGRNAFISMQSGTMPGVKIGRDAVVGPFTNVMHDVPDGALLYAEQKGAQRLRDADAD
ncbi:MAG: hypothetical protein M5R40_23785 [Anaerolineae bacterium]|nr:hypothetical protein [Anaerolineae bacterium]